MESITLPPLNSDKMASTRSARSIAWIMCFVMGG
jgi:hypothetical protein